MRKRYIGNFIGTNLLKTLYKDHAFVANKAGSQAIVKRATEIFNAVKEPKNHFLINTMLKLCVHLDSREDVVRIWNYTKNVDSKIQKNISYPLILKYFVSTNSLDECFDVLKWMKLRHFALNVHVSIICKLILKCQTLDKLKHIHHLIQINVIQNDETINCSLVKMFGYFQDVQSAQEIFEISQKDNIITCVMMNVLMKNEQHREALHLYSGIGQKDAICHSLALKICSHLKDIDFGMSIDRKLTYAEKKNIKLLTSLIEFYGECGRMKEAIKIFSAVANAQKDVAMIGCIMKAYIHNSHYEDALSIYKEIEHKYKFKADSICHSFAIKACGYLKEYDFGKQIHQNIDCDNIKIKTSLIEFYGNCKDLSNAQDTFFSIDNAQKDTICIGAMMTAYMNNLQYDEALSLYERCESHSKVNKMSLCPLYIKACAANNDFAKGKDAISQIPKEINSDSKSMELQNTLIAFYGTFGEMDAALNIFHSIADDKKDIVTFNAMMTALINNDHFEEALRLYDSMDTLEMDKDEMSHSLALKACGSLNNMNRAQQIISSFGEKEFQSLQIQNTLIDLYGDCGDLQSALNVFDAIKDEKKDIVSVNAMMAAYIANSQISEAQKLFDERIDALGLTADCKTYSILLNGCSHCGDLEKALKIWKHIDEKSVKYHQYVVTAMVDCCARRGLFQDALDMISRFEEFTNKPYYSMWMALLSAARNPNDLTMTQNIFEQIENRFYDNHTVINRAKVLLSNAINISILYSKL